MFSRTLLFRQILSELKRFLTDNSHSQQLVRKICPFYGQIRLKGLLNNLPPAAVTYQ